MAIISDLTSSMEALTLNCNCDLTNVTLFYLETIKEHFIVDTSGSFFNQHCCSYGARVAITRAYNFLVLFSFPEPRHHRGSHQKGACYILSSSPTYVP